jgi:hypothetical protein
MVMRYTTNFIGSDAVNGVIITLGLPVAPLANFLVCILYITRLLSKKPMGAPVWLAMTNFIFLIIQIFVQFILV